MVGFVTPMAVGRSRLFPTYRCQKKFKRSTIAVSMQLTTGKASLYCGIGVLAGVLTNRLLLTPLDSLAMTQSRSDILGVIAGATLVLYGVGKAEIADVKKAVEMDGQYVRQGFNDSSYIGQEVEWAASAISQGAPNVCSFALVIDGVGKCFIGKFRNSDVEMNVVDNGTISNAMASGKRAYLADMKVVPVKEMEFGFLPSNCQV